MTLKITFGDSSYSISDVEGSINDFVNIFGVSDRRLITDKADQIARYYRREFCIYTSLVNNMPLDQASKYQSNIDKAFDIITRTPIIIVRRNAQAIAAMLGNIGVISLMLGKIDQFIDFAKEVLENNLYISETSLQEYNGHNYYNEKKFSLPESVEPYKALVSPKSILNLVYTKICEDISERETTSLIASLIKTNNFLYEQMANDLSFKEMFFYKTDEIQSISDLYSFIKDNSKMDQNEILHSIFYNPSIYGNYGVIKYGAKDAKFVSSFGCPDGTMRYYNALRRVFVEDLEFYFKLDPTIDCSSIEISSDLYKNLSANQISEAISRIKFFPQSLLEHSLIKEVDIPLETFVKHIDKLFVYNSSMRVRDHFETKYKLQDIVNILH